MLKGIKKAFSFNRKSPAEAEVVEAADEHADAGDAPVAVRPKAKAGAATIPHGDSPAPHPSGGHHQQGVAPAARNAAWSFGNLAAEDGQPGRSRSGTSPAGTAPIAVQAHSHASASAAAAATTPPPAASSAAWGASSPPEKDGLHKQSKLSAMFNRSTSKGRAGSASGPTVVKPVGDILGHFSEKWQEDRGEHRAPGSPHGGPHAVTAIKHAGMTDDDEGNGYQSAGRGGAARTGSLMATPLALEDRRVVSLHT